MKLTAENVAYARGGKQILKPTSLALTGTGTTVLLGPNGAGKSTLMKILSGYLAPDQGEVNLDDGPLNALSLESRARLLGVLTQRNELDFPFTAEEVIAMGRSPHRTGSERDENQVHGHAAVVQQVMQALSIEPGRVFTTLSGGEKQLVQLARVFAQVWQQGERGYLLLDEPMTALDLRHQQIVVSILRAFSGEGTGQLIVMHDINLAAEVADEVILMSAGEVVAKGVPAEVLTVANLEATFSTPMQRVGVDEHIFFRTV